MFVFGFAILIVVHYRALSQQNRAGKATRLWRNPSIESGLRGLLPSVDGAGPSMVQIRARPADLLINQTV